MNIIVVVDRKLRIQNDSILSEHPGVVDCINNLIYNNIFVSDKKTVNSNKYFKNFISLKFDRDKKEKTKLPEFLAPIDTDINKVVKSYDDLFREINRHNLDKIFFYGNKFTFALLPYCENVYQISCNEILEDGKEFCNLNMRDDWKFVSSGNPFFDNGNSFVLVQYKNKFVEEYEIKKKEIIIQ